MSQEKVRKIHEATMRILERTGMKFIHPDSQKILKENGIRMEGDVAFFTEDQIMKWVKMAPSEFAVRAINPENDIVIGGDNVVNGVTIVTSVMERDGTERPASIADYVKLLKLYESYENLGVQGGLTVEPAEIPVYWKDVVMNYITLCHSEKALYSAGGNYEQMEAVIEMTRTRFGMTVEEMMKQPIILGLANTNSPLILDKEMVETILTFAKYRQPIIIASAAMAGTTAPVTIAGTIAITNAEVIATIAMTQMFAPGTPVLYGSQSTVADMRTGGIAIGAAESALCAKYCAKMAKFYGLPCRGGGALTDAKAFDPQAAFEGTLTYYACADNKMNLILHAAGVMNGYLSMSFEKVVMDFEIINYVNRYLGDIEVNEETVPEDVIHEVGHANHFLMEDHTLEYCRVDPLEVHLPARGVQPDPKTFYHNIDRRIQELVDAYTKPEVPPERQEAMRNIMRARGIAEDVITKCDAE